MTSTLPDLAPAVASRVVSIDATTVTEDAPKAGHVDFTLPCDLHSVSGGKILAAGSTRVTLTDGRGEVRLPVYSDDATTPDQGDDWVILVKKSWSSHPYAIRVPAGSSAISLAELPAVRTLTRREQMYAITGVALTVTEGTQAGGTAQYRNGLIDLNITVPPFRPQTVYPYINTTVQGEVDQRLEGVANAYELAVDRGYSGTMDEWLHSLIGPRGPEGPHGGTEVTDPQVASMLADTTTEVGGLVRDMFPSTSSTTVSYWVSPTGDDFGPGSEATPFRTIAKAVSMIPDIIRAGHEYTINLAEGDWDERLAVENRNILGLLTVQGSTADRYAHTIRDAYTQNVQGHFVIRNIHSSKTVPGIHFRYNASGPRMELDNVSGTGEVTDEPHSSGNQGVLADYGSSVIVENSRFDYKDYGLRSNYGSNIMSRENTGTGNTHGVGARFGGRIEMYGTAPHGYNSMASFSSGGTVVHDTGGYIGVRRYNEAINKTDTYGLVHQTTLQGQGNITPTKHWVSRGSTTRQGEMSGGGGDIPDGSTLRIYFQMVTHLWCVLEIEVMSGWIAVGGGVRRFMKGLLVPYITDTEARSPELFVMASRLGSGGIPEDQLQVGHTGADGIFYLDFTPNGGSDSSTYGLDIRISNMRHHDAPIMLGAEVL